MMQIQSYIDQLEDLAMAADLPLKRAFMLAGVPDSTFYRVLHGQDLRLDTAQKIAGAIEKWNQHDGSTPYQERSYQTCHA